MIFFLVAFLISDFFFFFDLVLYKLNAFLFLYFRIIVLFLTFLTYFQDSLTLLCDLVMLELILELADIFQTFYQIFNGHFRGCFSYFFIL